MVRIYSKVDSTIELATTISLEDIDGSRQSLSADSEPLQIGAIRWPLGSLVPPHKHLSEPRNTVSTQEAWIVITGLIKCRIFDLDNSFVTEVLLSPGSCIVLKNGGHELQCLADQTVMYEIKNGEYFGPARDKESLFN